MTEQTAREQGMAAIIADIIYTQSKLEENFDRWATRAWKNYGIEPCFLACDIRDYFGKILLPHAEELEKKLGVPQE